MNLGGSEMGRICALARALLAVLLVAAAPGIEMQQRGAPSHSMPCSVAQQGALGGVSTGRGRRGSMWPWKIPTMSVYAGVGGCRPWWRQEDEDGLSVSGAYHLVEVGCTGAMRLRGGGGKKAKERRKLLRSQGRILDGEAEGKVMKPKRREKKGMRESGREKGKGEKEKKEKKVKRGRGMEKKREGGGKKEEDHVNEGVESSFALDGKMDKDKKKKKEMKREGGGGEENGKIEKIKGRDKKEEEEKKKKKKRGKEVGKVEEQDEGGEVEKAERRGKKVNDEVKVGGEERAGNKAAETKRFGGDFFGTGKLVGLDRKDARMKRKRDMNDKVKAAVSAGYGIKEGSKANNMLRAMGWKPGEGIGKDGTGVKAAVEAGGKIEPDMLGVGAQNPNSPWGLLNNIHKAADEAFSQSFDISRLQEHLTNSMAVKKKRAEGQGGGASVADDDDDDDDDAGEDAKPGEKEHYHKHKRERAREGDRSIAAQSSGRLNPVCGKDFRKQKMKLKNKQTFGSIDIDYRTPNRIVFD